MPTILLKLLPYVAAALLASFGTWYVTHGLDERKYLAREVGLRAAEAKAAEINLAVERSMAAVNLNAAVKQGNRQQAILTRTLNNMKEVLSHVTPNSPCITLGFIRVLDAEVLGVSADDLPLAAGQSDDACSPLSTAAVAERIVRNFGIARQNAEQLDGLIENVSARQKAVARPPG